VLRVIEFAVLQIEKEFEDILACEHFETKEKAIAEAERLTALLPITLDEEPDRPVQQIQVERSVKYYPAFMGELFYGGANRFRVVWYSDQENRK